MWLRPVTAVFVSCVVTSVWSVPKFEDNEVEPEDFLQDLTDRAKKSPSTIAVADTFQQSSNSDTESESDSELKTLLADDIKLKIEELKKLKDAYRKVKAEVYGDVEKKNETRLQKLNNILIDSDNKTSFETKLPSEEVSLDEDSIRIARQYFSRGQQFFPNRQQYFPQGQQYGTENFNSQGSRFENSYSNSDSFQGIRPSLPSRNFYERTGNPYIAAYNPWARTFGAAGIQEGVETGIAHSDDQALEGQVVEGEKAEDEKGGQTGVFGGGVYGGYGGVGYGGGHEVSVYGGKDHKKGGYGVGGHGGGGFGHEGGVKPLKQLKQLIPIAISALSAITKPVVPVEPVKPVAVKPVKPHKVVLHKIEKPKIEVHKKPEILPAYSGKKPIFFSKQIIFGIGGGIGEEHQSFGTPHQGNFPEGHSTISPSYQGAYYYTPSYSSYSQGQAYFTPSYSVYPQGHSYYAPSYSMYPEGSSYYSPVYSSYPEVQSNYGSTFTSYPQGHSYFTPSSYYSYIPGRNVNESPSSYQPNEEQHAVFNDNNNNVENENKDIIPAPAMRAASEEKLLEVDEPKSLNQKITHIEPNKKIEELQETSKKNKKVPNSAQNEENSYSDQVKREMEEVYTNWKDLKERIKQTDSHPGNSEKDFAKEEQKT